MQKIQSLPNPFIINLASRFDEEAEKRNKQSQKIALIVLSLGVLASIGAGTVTITVATFSAVPVIASGLAVIISIAAYKAFLFIRDINKYYDKALLYGGTRLHLSALKGQVMMTRLLLLLGANPNLRSGMDNTPLHMACFDVDKPNSEDHIKVMDLLVKAGANVNASGNYGRCPLHYALDARHVDRVAFLVNNGAFINLKDTFKEEKSPWEYAIIMNNQSDIYSRTGGETRSNKALLDAGKRIYQILEEKGKVYSV